MGIFNKKENQQNYINLVRKTAEDVMPEVAGWDMTLTSFDSGALATLKKASASAAKHVAINAVAGMVGLHVRSSANPYAETIFITCFKGNEIYFLSIGNGISKSNLEIDPDTCFHFTSSEFESIKTGMGKKVSLNLRDGGKFVFKYGVGAGTIYSIPEGDKKLEVFVKTLIVI